MADVQELLEAGIKVIASVNIQYVDELRADVESITGKHIRETVPASFIKSADEIEIVDAPAGEPVERSGANIADKARGQQFARLRELALVLAADVVDHQLEHYLAEHGITQHLGTHERILICITPRSNIQPMIATARVIAAEIPRRTDGCLRQPAEFSASDRLALEEKLKLAREAGAQIEILEGEDPANAILGFAKSRGITQLFIGHSQRGGIRERFLGNPVDKLIEHSYGMDVRIFPQ